MTGGLEAQAGAPNLGALLSTSSGSVLCTLEFAALSEAAERNGKGLG